MLVETDRQIVIGSSDPRAVGSSWSRSNVFASSQSPCLFRDPDRFAPLVMVFSCETPQGHPSGIDLALEDERFFAPPNVVEAARNIVLSGDDFLDAVRPIAPERCQMGPEHRKRVFRFATLSQSAPEYSHRQATSLVLFRHAFQHAHPIASATAPWNT